MYIKKYICTTYVKYHSTSLSSPPVIPHLMRDLSPPVIPHLMRDPFSLDSRLRGNDTFFVIPHLMRDPFSLDSRLRGNDGKKSGNDTPLCHPQPTAPVSSSTDCPLVILNRKRSASDWGSSTSRHPALDAGSIQSGFPLARE